MPPSDVRRYKSLPERVLFFLLLCVDDVKVRGPYQVFCHARRPGAPRCGTPTTFATILLGCVHDSVYLTVDVPEYVSY